MVDRLANPLLNNRQQFIPCASRIDALEHNFTREGRSRSGNLGNFPYGCPSANLATNSGDTFATSSGTIPGIRCNRPLQLPLNCLIAIRKHHWQPHSRAGKQSTWTEPAFPLHGKHHLRCIAPAATRSAIPLIECDYWSQHDPASPLA
jgi:hypothetical protein